MLNSLYLSDKTYFGLYFGLFFAYLPYKFSCLLAKMSKNCSKKIDKKGK